ncbi:hypothetical protein HEP_00189500 [Hepatocystis sp. ex Piliocolobus tephrosceles]|nr:hypothetical protein HEP_00189500 [Hepatocystis sp. ex Piliocolobus tephrosceles]
MNTNMRNGYNLNSNTNYNNLNYNNVNYIDNYRNSNYSYGNYDNKYINNYNNINSDCSHTILNEYTSDCYLKNYNKNSCIQCTCVRNKWNEINSNGSTISVQNNNNVGSVSSGALISCTVHPTHTGKYIIHKIFLQFDSGHIYTNMYILKLYRIKILTQKKIKNCK